MIKILFTGGGSGGHIYPLIAVAEELENISKKKTIDLEMVYLGAYGSYRQLLEINNIRAGKILSSKLRRYFSPMNFIDMAVILPISVIQALWKVFWSMPDVLFSKGGPGSLPVVLACKLYGVPIIIHESDSEMGLSNKMAMRFAKKIELSFESLAEKIIKEKINDKKLPQKISVIGNPVRKSLIAQGALSQEESKKVFGLNQSKQTLFVICGSQGASRINEFFLENAKELVKNFQVIHQSGIKNFDNFKKELNVALEGASEEEKNRYKPLPYLEKELKDAYSAADVVISRASSGTIFEIAAFNKPSILIPIPENIAHDQTRNAYEYAATGATIVMEEENLKPHLFLDQLEKIGANPETIKKMSEAAKNFSKPQAARILAERILSFAI